MLRSEELPGLHCAQPNFHGIEKSKDNHNASGSALLKDRICTFPYPVDLAIYNHSQPHRGGTLVEK